MVGLHGKQKYNLIFKSTKEISIANKLKFEVTLDYFSNFLTLSQKFSNVIFY